MTVATQANVRTICTKPRDLENAFRKAVVSFSGKAGSEYRSIKSSAVERATI